MMFFGNSKPDSPFSDFKDQLHAIPVRNEKLVWVDKGEDWAVVGVGMKYSGAMKVAKKLLKLGDSRKFQVDGLGYWLLMQLDERKTVESHINALAAKEKLTFFEARALILQFLHRLINNGLVAVAIPKNDDE